MAIKYFIYNYARSRRSRKITSKTIDRVNIVKSYIEKKYSLRKQKNDEKNKGKKYLIINYI